MIILWLIFNSFSCYPTLGNIKTAPDSCKFPCYMSLHELLQKDGIINHTSQSQELQVLSINNQIPDLTSQFKP